MPVEIAGAIPFDTDQLHVAYDADAGAPVLARTGADEPRLRGVPVPLRRQGQPGALLLGRTRSGGHPVLRTHRAQTSRRRAELRSARHVGGVLPRSQQRRILAGPATAKASSTPTPTPSRPAIGMRPSRRRRRRSTKPWASSRCPTPRCARPTTPTPCCSSSCRAPTTSPPTRATGTAPPWNAGTDGQTASRIPFSAPTYGSEGAPRSITGVSNIDATPGRPARGDDPDLRSR